MEKIIVAIIVLGAIYMLIRLFKKQTSGKDGCACGSKCDQCPTVQDETSGQ